MASNVRGEAVKDAEKGNRKGKSRARERGEGKGRKGEKG